MIAQRLVQIIEKHSDELAQGLMSRVMNDPRLAGMSVVPPEEIEHRVYEVYHNLGEWLTTKPESEIERRWSVIGARRAAQGVPLSTLLAAILAVKDHLFDFMKREALADRPVEIFEELDLLGLIDQFFDRAVYHAARGYERAVAAKAA